MLVDLPDVDGPFHIEREGDDKLKLRIGEVAEGATPRTFAGFRLTTIALIAVIGALLAWNAWMTREVVALKHQKIVSVSLASIITDFVHDQSHAGGSPDEAAARTKLYLVATQRALTTLARNGTPVLASEAVLGNSVPDQTAQIKAAVAKALADQGGQH